MHSYSLDQITLQCFMNKQTLSMSSEVVTLKDRGSMTQLNLSLLNKQLMSEVANKHRRS